MVPLRFELLVDPLETLIVSENDLEHSADVRWNTQSSGVRLSERAAREIDKWLGVAELVTSSSAIAPGRHERVVELNARDQGLVRELKRIMRENAKFAHPNRTMANSGASQRHIIFTG